MVSKGLDGWRNSPVTVTHLAHDTGDGVIGQGAKAPQQLGKERRALDDDRLQVARNFSGKSQKHIRILEIAGLRRLIHHPGGRA